MVYESDLEGMRDRDKPYSKQLYGVTKAYNTSLLDLSYVIQNESLPVKNVREFVVGAKIVTNV